LSAQKIAVDDKWTREEQVRLWCKSEELLTPRAATSIMRSLWGRLGKLIWKLVREADRSFGWRWLLVKPDQIVNIYRRKFETMG